ncbi:hypothetical protein PV783_24715 [Chitinophaga sp. CC14]|uniref:hypothetical protein n=1 Tax=Chitinophaga sp. CC14 TaxID=3029199 RepID=UPI003B7BD02D
MSKQLSDQHLEILVGNVIQHWAAGNSEQISLPEIHAAVKEKLLKLGAYDHQSDERIAEIFHQLHTINGHRIISTSTNQHC